MNLKIAKDFWIFFHAASIESHIKPKSESHPERFETRVVRENVFTVDLSREHVGS